MSSGRDRVTGILLAGGRATRMGGVDKGLVELAGEPLAAHVLRRLRPQVGHVLINANRNAEAYRRLGHEVVADTIGEFAGPLAGMLAGMENAPTDRVIMVPCDSPLLPVDLVERMQSALAREAADLAVAHDGARRQPAFLLARRELAPGLRAWLAAGGRKIDAWFQHLRVADADLADCPEAFVNINTREERDAVERRLTGANDDERQGNEFRR